MGKSFSSSNRKGERKIEKSTGKLLAPRSIRNQFRYLEDVPNEILIKILGE